LQHPRTNEKVYTAAYKGIALEMHDVFSTLMMERYFKVKYATYKIHAYMMFQKCNYN
jgi:hypothetical protein